MRSKYDDELSNKIKALLTREYQSPTDISKMCGVYRTRVNAILLQLERQGVAQSKQHIGKEGISQLKPMYRLKCD